MLICFIRIIRLIVSVIAVFTVLSCQPTDYNAIDGSSQKAYNRSLTSVLKKIPDDKKDAALFIIEMKFAEFSEKHPTFLARMSNKTETRPPEFLALIDGLTVDDLLLEVDKLRKRLRKRQVEAARHEERQKIEQARIEKINKKLEPINKRIKEIERKLNTFGGVFQKDIDMVRAAENVSIKAGTPRLKVKKSISISTDLIVPIEVTNKSKNGIYNLWIRVQAFEKGRQLPWIDQTKRLSFFAGLDSGETSKENIELWISGDKHYRVVKLKLKKLRFTYQPLMAALSEDIKYYSMEPKRAIRNYEEYNKNKFSALEKELNDLKKKKDDVLTEFDTPTNQKK